MKKILLVGMVISLGLGSINAQINTEELQLEMQRMQQEMLRQLEQLGMQSESFQFELDSFAFGDQQGGIFFMDTLLFNPLGDDLFFGQPDAMPDLFKSFEQQLSQMDAQDWQDVEQLFRALEEMMPAPPMQNIGPEGEQKPAEKQPPVKNGRKKRKVYAL